MVSSGDLVTSNRHPVPGSRQAVAQVSASDGERRQESGFAFLVLLTLLSLAGLSIFVAQLGATKIAVQRQELTATALVEAAQELIGDAARRLPVSDAGFLRLPDLGGSLPEGSASGTFTGDAKDLTVIGKFPWRTLATQARRDRHGECLWYVVSGSFKNDTDTLKTDVFNWDTLGQIDVVNASGQYIARNLAALMVAPGPAIDGQSHALAAAGYRECGGNYDARQYLDSFNLADAVVGEVNYFAGSINSRLAPGTSNKKFVRVEGHAHYNDQFHFITVDDIFNPLIRRRDFAAAIGVLLDDPYFQAHLKTVTVSGAKGTANVNCWCNRAICVAVTGDAFQTFCGNWKEMLLLTQLSAPAQITIDGSLSPVPCTRVVIFAGRKTASQSRDTPANRNNPLNYLEAGNETAFAVPVAASSSFAGQSVFTWRSPTADIVRCLS